MAEETSPTEPVAESGQANIAPAEGDGQTAGTSNTADTSPPEPTENWWDTTGLDDKTSRRIKDIQSHFTRTSQEASRLKKEVESGTQYKQAYDQFANQVRSAILSPDYMNQVEQARKQLMIQSGVTPGNTSVSNQPPQPRRLENMQDLMEYWKEREDWMETKLKAEYDMKLASEVNKIAMPIAKDKWQQADQSLRTKFPLYEKYSQRVLQSIASGPYAGLYQKGMDEKQVLEATFWHLAGPEIAQTSRQDALRSLETKKNAVTEKPKKATQMTSADGKSKEDAIAELRRSGLSFEVTQ